MGQRSEYVSTGQEQINLSKEVRASGTTGEEVEFDSIVFCLGGETEM